MGFKEFVLTIIAVYFLSGPIESAVITATRAIPLLLVSAIVIFAILKIDDVLSIIGAIGEFVSSIF